MKVWIYCGVPGSGKTTRAWREHEEAYFVSADDYFLQWEERSGRFVYRFEAAELPNAHASCLRRFVSAITTRNPAIVVDNTNTTAAEIAPYAALALAFGYELQVITLKCDPTKAYERNIHGVPLAAVEAMHRRLEATMASLPPWWPLTVIEAD